MTSSAVEKITEKMLKKGRKEILLLVFLLSGFLFVILSLVFSYHLSTEQRQISPILGPLVSYHVEFMVAVATLGIAVGAGAFFLFSEMMEKSRAEAHWNASLLLKFLGGDERAVVGLMLKRNGTAYQSEIAALEGMSRVRAHRVIAKLGKRGIVEIRKIGKINALTLPQELLDGLKTEKGE